MADKESDQTLQTDQTFQTEQIDRTFQTNQSTLHTVKCHHCGDLNDVGNAICANCLTPMTAYGGQVGQANNFEGKLAAQVAALDERPLIVTAMSLFSVVFALVVPLWTVIRAWRAQPHVNDEGTNAIQAATGILVPLFQTVMFLPIAIALCIIAYFTWTQRPWAWTANVVILALIAVLAVVSYGIALPTFLWIGTAAVLAGLWYQRPVKAWFALG